MHRNRRGFLYLDSFLTHRIPEAFIFINKSSLQIIISIYSNNRQKYGKQHHETKKQRTHSQLDVQTQSGVASRLAVAIATNEQEYRELAQQHAAAQNSRHNEKRDE